MKRKMLKSCNRVLALFLSMLGIGGACTFSGCAYGVEYGTPHATFKVHGKVTNEQNAGIPEIKVVMAWDSAKTDQDGFYQIETTDFPADQEFFIDFSDVDGAQNGSFQNKDTLAVFKDPNFEGGSGSWYRGETSKELNVRLKEKEE